MRRREFITLARRRGSAWPLAARAQQGERMRRIGVLTCPAAPTMRNIRPAWRHSCRRCSNWAGATAATCGSTSAGPAGDADHHSQICGRIGRARAGRHPGPLAATTVGPLLQATRTVPIVFAIVPDPVGAGFVDSLARPGGNATGFIAVRIWLEREMAGTAQGNRARRDASGGPAGSRHSRRDRPVCHNPVRGAVVRSGVAARSTCATPARSSAPSRPSRAPRMAV